MKRSLICVLALAALSFSASAQESRNSKSSDPTVKDVEAVAQVKINDADRAEMKKGAKLVLSGANGFFGALRAAVDQAHRERGEKENVVSKQDAKKDKASSP